MIFEIEHLFGSVDTSWTSGEEGNQYHRRDLLAEKTPSVTLNDINSRNEVRGDS